MKKEKGIIMEKALPLMGEDSNNLSPVGLPWIGGKKKNSKGILPFFLRKQEPWLICLLVGEP